jgi:3-isopropylmalate/(R)-2-methylmalate dehydratase large subunit
MGKTIAEKILGAKSGRDVRAGDVVLVSADALMAHDARLGQTMSVFDELGAPRRFCGDVVLVLDHYSPPPAAQHAALHDRIRAFASRLGATLYGVGEGICHNLMTERGHVAPGRLVVGTDSHSLTYGALNCFGTGIESSDAVALLATGKLWLRVPETIRVELAGIPPAGVSAKDVTLWLLRTIGEDGAAYRALEFCGDGWAAMGMDARFTLSNHAAELGAKAALQPFDARTRDWLRERSIGAYEPVLPDPDARYAETIVCDLRALTPQVAVPYEIDRVTPVEDVASARINVAFIGSCTNARLDDLRSAVAAIAGRKIAPGMRLLVNPGSSEVYLAAQREGILDALADAGATILPPGCGSCVAMNRQYVPAEGDVVVSTANRNFKGRLGDVPVYIASPATVAASAVAGRITAAAPSPSTTAPRPSRSSPRRHAERGERSGRSRGAAPLIQGRAHLLGDRVNTDVLFTNKYDDRGQSLEEIAARAARSVPGLQPGDVLVAGTNFGAVSSREQAVKVMRRLGIAAVLAKSFARLFYRNAINNGLYALPCDTAQIRAGDRVEIDPRAGRIVLPDRGLVLETHPLPPFLAELIEAGGLLEYVRLQRL